MSRRDRKLLVDDRPLLVLRSLAKEIGLNEAIVLQQIHYWLPRSSTLKEGRKWVYKTLDEWRAEFPFWSGPTIRRAIARLRARKLVDVTKESSTSWNRQNFYSINYAKLESLVSSIASNRSNANAQIDHMQQGILIRSMSSVRSNRSSQPDQITSTETTAETTSKPASGKGPKPVDNYQPPAAADLKFPDGTTPRQQQSFLQIAREYGADRGQLQLAFDEVQTKLERREPVRSRTGLVRDIVGRQMRDGTFDGERAAEQERKRGGGRPLTAAELKLVAGKKAA